MNRTLLKIVSLISFFTMLQIYSYEKPLQLHHYAKREWSSISGLAHDNVTSLYVDSEGIVWAGTIEGLSRISGTEIRNFSTRTSPELLSNRIVSVAGNRSGDIAVATEMGVSVIKRTTVRSVLKEVDLVGAALKDDGTVYAASSSELFVAEKKEIRKFNIINGLPEGKITSIGSDGEKVYFGNDDGSIYRLEAGAFSKNLCEKNKSSVTSISCDENGTVAFGTKQGQIFKIENDSCIQVNVDSAVAFAASEIISIDIENDQLRAVSDEYILSIKGNDVTAFRDKEQLPGSLSGVVVDKDGMMWVAGNRGLKLFYAGEFVTLGKDEGLSSEMAYAMVEDKFGKIWVGTRGGGLFYYVDGKFNQVTENSGLPSRFVGGLMVDSDKNIWAGTARGIVKFKPELPVKMKVVPTVRKDTAPLASVIFQDSKKRIWAGTANGEIYMFIKDGFAFIRSTGDGENNYISAIKEDESGRLWFATSRGLLVLENDAFEIINSGKGLPDNLTLSLYFDKETGNLFVGSMRKGLSIVKKTGKGLKIGNVNTTKGLCSDTIFSISEDKDKNLWFTSTQGIFNLKKEDILKASENESFVLRCLNYDRQDGIKRPENTGGVQPPVMFSDPGRKWFPTVEGIAVKTENVSENMAAHVVIDDFLVNGKKVEFKKDLKLKGDISLLEIPFAAGRFIHPERLKIQYRLIPFENEWKEVSSRFIAVYQKVPAGEYEFVVKTMDEKGRVVKKSVFFNVSGISVFTVVILSIFAVILIGSGYLLVVRRKALKAVDDKNPGIQPVVKNKKTEKEQSLDDDVQKYEKSRLDDEIARSYADELKQLMLDRKVFTDPDLTMPDLATMLDLSPNVLSQVINGYCGLNFYTYINNFRADEVVEIMKKDVKKEKNVLDIAFAAGFKSKTTFNTFFKKHTGLTPSEFRKQLEKDRKAKNN